MHISFTTLGGRVITVPLDRIRLAALTDGVAGPAAVATRWQIDGFAVAKVEYDWVLGCLHPETRRT